jgi:DNA-binding response OmpR family regulator
MIALSQNALRVLIVDDYPGIVELYDLALAARGFQVVGASTAGQAMTLAANEPFDAVVLDVELPDGSGPDLAEKLRRIPSLAKATIVGMSSYASTSASACFDAFLSKPLHPKRLAAVLRRLLNRPPALAQA